MKGAIQSVIDQTYTNYELIIVDDHSTDETHTVVESFADNRIKYIKNDHKKGPGGARNAGINRANGKWVAFLDSDDVWFPEKLETLYNKIQGADNEVGLIYTGFVHYDFDKKQEVRYIYPEKKGWVQEELFYKNYIGTLSIVAVRTDALRRIDGIDERLYMGEDADLYIRIAGLYKIDFIREVLTYYRVSNTDKLSLNLENALVSFKLIREKHKNIINRSPHLRHRSACRVFETAVKLGNYAEIYRVLPWTLLGIIFDVNNLARTIRSCLSYFRRQKRTKTEFYNRK